MYQCWILRTYWIDMKISMEIWTKKNWWNRDWSKFIKISRKTPQNDRKEKRDNWLKGIKFPQYCKTNPPNYSSLKNDPTRTKIPLSYLFSPFSLKLQFSLCYVPSLPCKSICSICYLARKKSQRTFPFIAREHKANTTWGKNKK